MFSSCFTLLVWFSPSLANKYTSCGRPRHQSVVRIEDPRYGYHGMASKAFQISSCLWLFALKHALKPCAAKHLVAFVICHNETCFCRCFLATNAASGPYLSSKGAELGATSSLSSASFILSVAKDQRRSASRSTSMTARLRLKS